MSLYEDKVDLTLGGSLVLAAEGYEIKAGVLTQPSGFAIRVGHGGLAREILERFPEGTKAEIAINGHPFQTGAVDSVTSGEGSGATQITFGGRDRLGRLFDAYVQSERSFSGQTYAELNREVLFAAGLTDFTLEASSEAWRKRATGVTVKVGPPKLELNVFTTNSADAVALAAKRLNLPENITEGDLTVTDRADGSFEAVFFRDAVDGTSKQAFGTIKAKGGTRWFDWLKEHNDRAGFFLMSNGVGGFCLFSPDGRQEPYAELVHERANAPGPRGRSVRHTYRRDIKDRYTKWIVFGKGGGVNFGRGSIRGQFVDQEMVRILGGEDAKIRVHHDATCKTPRQCDYLARRLCAEANRAGWVLEYEVAGLSVETPRGRANWMPETVVSVIDREIGVERPLYLESVEMHRSPHTSAKLRFMRPEDLVFALDAEGPK